ncbi:MAG: MFS transporter [Cellvibrionaceae bacterium]|nr:MFS transporter [Cellvibrionaceae bacterium]
MPSQPLSQVRSVTALAALYIVRMLGLFMVLPVLALAGAEYGTDNMLLLGIALGIYGATQALLQIPYGLLSDRFGRKPLIVIGLLVFALGSLIAACAESIGGLIIGRALQGGGAIAGVIMAAVGDLTTEENRTKAMAAIGAAIGLAFALALVIGPLISSVGGVRWVFGLTVVLTVVAIAIVFLYLPTMPPPSESSISLSAIKPLLGEPDLLRLCLGIFVLHAVLTALFIVFPLLLQMIGFAKAIHYRAYLGLMLGAFVLMVPLIVWGERKQQLKLVFLSVLLMLVVVLLAFSMATLDASLVLLGMLVFFVGFNYLEASLPSLMTKLVSGKQRGLGSGIFSTCQFAGAAVGGVLGGYLYNYMGMQAVFFICAAAIFIWWLFALGMRVPKPVKVAPKNVVA